MTPLTCSSLIPAQAVGSSWIRSMYCTVALLARCVVTVARTNGAERNRHEREIVAGVRPRGARRRQRRNAVLEARKGGSDEAARPTVRRMRGRSTRAPPDGGSRDARSFREVDVRERD